MRILIDTNVILDFILDRQPHQANAAAIFDLIAGETIEAYTTASSITDIYYLIRKYRDDLTTRAAIRTLLETFHIIAVDMDDCQKALNLPIPDFEDALVIACADKTRLDYIVTNDSQFLKLTLANAVKPEDFLKICEASITEQDILDVTVKDRQIILKAAEKLPTLEKIFTDWDGRPPETFDWGEPVGKELL
jgi:predicted nucleic acid-binding protein